jgi:hypothetical protein
MEEPSYGGYSSDEDDIIPLDEATADDVAAEVQPAAVKAIHIGAEWKCIQVSRIFRCRLDLNSITGICLFQPHGDENAKVAVCALELSRPADNFAVREFMSSSAPAMQWKKRPDWTPQSICSQATRQYIIGPIGELTELVNYLILASPHIAQLVEQPKKNSLKCNEGSLSPKAAPVAPHASHASSPAEDNKQADLAHSEDSLRQTRQKLHKLITVNGGNGLQPSACVLAAVHNGHIDLNQGLNQVRFLVLTCW